MRLNAAPNVRWSLLSEFIAERMGLHFPPERWTDLQRGLDGVAVEFGFVDVTACVDWVLTASLSKAELQVLASHLTVGETYFFRDQRTFDVLSESVLPELIRLRRNCGRRLRIWSAACCTGEEPYSLAILLHQIIPDLSEWRVTILATDINGRFLQKACAGVYGEWSFRQTTARLKERYFRCAGEGRFAILPEIKQLVTFANLNLVEDVFPALATDTNAMDVIFCRNVLMYFTLSQAQKVVWNLHHSLVEGGWLAVSPTEGSQALLAGFAPGNFPGAILYQKHEAGVQAAPSSTPTLFPASTTIVASGLNTLLPCAPQMPVVRPLELPAALPRKEAVPAESRPTPRVAAASLYDQGCYAEAADTLLNSFVADRPRDGSALSLLARALANQGKLADALVWCDQWVAIDKLDSSAHYLRAVVLQELGDKTQGRGSLQRAIYLDPNFILAHFALGNLARSDGNGDEAERHFSNAAHLLRSCPPSDILPESDGLTAGRLSEIISSIAAMETSHEE